MELYTSILLLGLLGRCCCLTLDTVHEWTSVQFEYVNKNQETKDIKSGRYNSSNVVIYSSEIFKGKNNRTITFVTTPDFIPGTPFTLSTISSKKGIGGPMLRPFPNAAVHKVSGDCNSITNVWRVKVDKYGRLWVVDNGKTNTLRAIKYVCPPQILIYDINDNIKLIRRYKVPGLSAISLLGGVEFEYLDNTNKENMIGYFNDQLGSSMVVYSLKNNTSFIVNHPYFSPDPNEYSFFNLNGVSFYKMIGIHGFAITPKDGQGKSKMYFHALSSGREGVVPTDIIRDKTKNSYTNYKSDYTLLDDRGFHSSAEVITNHGVMIFPDLDSNSLMSWDTSQPYSYMSFTTLIQDEERLQFPTSLQLVEDNSTETLIYITVSRLHRVMVGVPERDQTNYRILKGNINNMDAGDSSMFK